MLHDCVTALSRVAAYRLPRAIDQRLLWLSENKDSLSPEEREELFALVEMAEGRTLEKLEATATRHQLRKVFPALDGVAP